MVFFSIQCNLLRNLSLNVFDGGVTNAFYETLGRLSYRVTDRICVKELLQRLQKVGTYSSSAFCDR